MDDNDSDCNPTGLFQQISLRSSPSSSSSSPPHEEVLPFLSAVGAVREEQAPNDDDALRRRPPSSSGLWRGQGPLRLVLVAVVGFVAYVVLPSVFFGGPLRGYRRYYRSCSCLNPRATRDCCRRELLVEHKFGTFLVSSIFHPMLNDLRLVARVDGDGRPSVDADANNAANIDYRHVVTTRNWFDSLVSGYLYHRTGRECWLTTNGQPRSVRNWTIDWDSQLWSTHRWSDNEDGDGGPPVGLVGLLDPPRHNRSICQYLQEESEVDGLRAYMDWTLHRYYGGLVAYRERAEREAAEGGNNGNGRRSMFVCYEDWMNATRRDALYEASLAFLFPGGGSDRVRWHGPPSPAMADSNWWGRSVTLATANDTAANATTATDKQYAGGHATDHDPELRARLLELVHRLDETVFDHTVRDSDAVFGCGGNKP